MPAATTKRTAEELGQSAKKKLTEPSAAKLQNFCELRLGPEGEKTLCYTKYLHDTGFDYESSILRMNTVTQSEAP